MGSQSRRLSKRRKIPRSSIPALEGIYIRSDFKYPPLEERQIRVLELNAGSCDEDLIGDLHPCDLQDADYSAISYAWGSSDLSHSIKLGDKYLRIGAAAHGALRRFRKPLESRRLWIDSVCINQDDMQERNAQVGHMDEVYRNANDVLVWLGESSTSDSMAIWTCHQLNTSWTEWNLCQKTLESSQWDGASKSGFARRSLKLPRYPGSCPCCDQVCDWQPPAHKDELDNDMALLDVALKSLLAFFSKPYFTRLWPVQEICMARVCTFHTGTHFIEFEDLCRALEMSTTLQSRFRSILRLYAMVRESTFAARASPGRIFRLPLLDLIAVTHQLKAKEGHDRIYALRGLTLYSTARKLAPDYRASLRHLWINAAVCILKDRCGGSDGVSVLPSVASAHPSVILAQAAAQRQDFKGGETRFPIMHPGMVSTAVCDHRDNSAGWRWEGRRQFFETLRLPSWVADLEEDVNPHWLKYEQYNGHVKFFYAGGKSDFDVRQIPQVNGSLEVRVVSTSTIAKFHMQLGGTALDWYSCCHFARSWGHFPVLEAGNSQERYAAVDDLTVLLLQGRQNLTEDGINVHLKDLGLFVKLFINDGVDSMTRSQTRYRALQEKKEILRLLDNTESREIARKLFARTFPTVRGTTGAGTIDLNRVLATFSDGRIGWVPSRSQSGDTVRLLQGAPCPFIFRDRMDGTFENIGDAYVHGIMYGEAWPEHEDEVRSIVLS